ncbi:AAA family ATPase [Pricia antarctica]|uniref:AAA family ATPase n=1 Tax=Pricia antarctica TaxID=641691 RepID=UPI001FE1AC7D|nr:ATP-binding protein [Pricia antarctica]
MNTKKIVITGGPSTGKTSVILELEKRGCFCIPELVRSLTVAEAAAKNMESIMVNPILSVKDPVEFNNKLLKGRIAQYRSVEKMEEKMVFFDRGIPDVHAYMTCFGQEYTDVFEHPAHNFRYDQVLLMPPWREIYATDAERFESYSTSERIFTALEKTYRNFGYEITLIPKGSVMERTDFILDLVNPK